MTGPKAPLTQEEMDFQAKCEKDTKEIRQFFKSINRPEDRYVEANPYYRLAPEYFQIYLDKQPSTIATQAVEKAFSMWRGVRGASHQVEKALTHLSYEEDVWETVGAGIWGSFVADDRPKEGLALIEDLVQRVIPLKSRSALLSTLAHKWIYGQEAHIEKARRAFEQIVEWDAHERLVEDARGYLYEFEHLCPGQPVPHFARNDIDGNRIDIADYRGCVVLLDFWASWCKPCYDEFSHLRDAAKKHPSDRFAIISISLDRSLEDLRACIEQEQLRWPHIWAEAEDHWNDPLVKLFNISGIPKTYLIDQKGCIAAKELRLESIGKAVASLLE